MIHNINVNEIGQTLGKTPLPHPDLANTRPPSDSDATIEVSFAEIINKARQAEEADSDAVQKARELLLSGRLTSPENIRAAAENILRFGI
jgi:hypothetical protein